MYRWYVLDSARLRTPFTSYAPSVPFQVSWNQERYSIRYNLYVTSQTAFLSFNLPSTVFNKQINTDTPWALYYLQIDYKVCQMQDCVWSIIWTLLFQHVHPLKLHREACSWICKWKSMFCENTTVAPGFQWDKGRCRIFKPLPMLQQWTLESVSNLC